MERFNYKAKAEELQEFSRWAKKERVNAKVKKRYNTMRKLESALNRTNQVVTKFRNSLQGVSIREIETMATELNNFKWFEEFTVSKEDSFKHIYEDFSKTIIVPDHNIATAIASFSKA